MKKRLFLIVIMIVCMLQVTACTKKYIATKLTQESQVPELVKEELQNVELERGAYFFAETFTGEDAYLVFCAGEEYTEGYNVEISGLEYNALIKTTDNPITPIYGFYKVNYEEKAETSKFDYGIKGDYPLVIYRISGKIGEQAWPVLPPDSNLSINKWWGSDATQLEINKGKCEVIELTEEEIPAGILKKFNREPGLKVYSSGNNQNIVELYFKIDSNNPTRINLESFSWLKSRGASYPCYLVTHEEPINSPTYEDCPFYYTLVKISLSNEYAFANRHLFFDNRLNWYIGRFHSISIDNFK